MNLKMYQINHNLEQEEINKFNMRAFRWWDPEGEFKLLHRINSLRLEYIIQRSGGLFRKKVLDVGCGGGILSESMSREGAIVTGIDMGLNPIKVAILHAKESKMHINYIQETVEEHAKRYTFQYDVVTCMEMLEHVPNPQSVVKACAQLTKPDGEVFFSTINRNRKSWLMVIICAEYLLRMIPKGMHDSKKFIKPSELLSWIDQTSWLREQHIIGLHYNPLIDKFRLGPGVDVNYILHTKAKN